MRNVQAPAPTAPEYTPTSSAPRRGPPPRFMPEWQPPARLSIAGAAPATSASSRGNANVNEMLMQGPDEAVEPARDDDDDGSGNGSGGDNGSSDSSPDFAMSTNQDPAEDIDRGDAQPLPAALAETNDSLLDPLADQLAGLGCDDGIFEVTMPDGRTLGVAVNVHANGVRFLMTPGDPEMRERIKNCRMELQGSVARRIHRNVDIAVL